MASTTSSIPSDIVNVLYYKAKRRQTDPGVDEARQHLIAFICRMYPEYEPSAVHREIAAAVEWAVETPGARLIVTVPPRHGKSTIISEHAPAWILGNNPDWEIIATSASVDPLATSFSRKAREMIRSPRWPWPQITISKMQAGVKQWAIDRKFYRNRTRGAYKASGIGGQIVGLGAELLIIDDPVKDAEAADSKTQRDDLWEWFQGVALTRLSPTGRVIMVGTRWHEDDLIGRTIQTWPDEWRVIHFPAVNANGEALWPERWNLARLAKKRAEVGARVWSAQYQGMPVPASGGILKPGWFGVYTALPADIMYYAQSWDTAFKTGQQHDYSVCITFAVDSLSNMYVVDVFREKLEFPDLERAYQTQTLAYRPRHSWIEDKASGQSLGQWARRQPSLKSTAIKMIPVPKSKTTRANQVAPYLEAGRVLLPLYAHWKDEFLKEIATFPLTEHDDQADTLTQAMAEIFMDATTPQASSRSYIDDDEADDDPGLYGGNY